jgi:predicted SAM-dependent methyltransferase
MMIANKSLKLHLGCGKRFLPGYTHIDLDKHPHIDYYHDIKTLPILSDASVDEIYTCGTFEYFDRVGEVQEVLFEWKRVLRRGGLLRLSVPDFEGIVRVYQENRDVDGIGILGPIFGRIEIDTLEGKKVLFHKTVYDYQSLCEILGKAGFKRIRRYDWRQFLPLGYDDFSAAYVPHMDPNGVPLGLNVVCENS